MLIEKVTGKLYYDSAKHNPVKSDKIRFIRKNGSITKRCTKIVWWEHFHKQLFPGHLKATDRSIIHFVEYTLDKSIINAFVSC